MCSPIRLTRPGARAHDLGLAAEAAGQLVPDAVGQLTGVTGLDERHGATLGTGPARHPDPTATGGDGRIGRVDDAPSPEAVELAHQLLDLARAGHTARLTAYVEAGVPADLTDAAGNTLLMLAAYHGHAATVRALAGLGADVDRLNDRGQSPLAGAVFKGEDDVVAALLELGADPDAGSPTARATAEMFGRSL